MLSASNLLQDYLHAAAKKPAIIAPPIRAPLPPFVQPAASNISLACTVKQRVGFSVIPDQVLRTNSRQLSTLTPFPVPQNVQQARCRKFKHTWGRCITLAHRVMQPPCVEFRAKKDAAAPLAHAPLAARQVLLSRDVMYLIIGRELAHVEGHSSRHGWACPPQKPCRTILTHDPE